LTLPLRRAEPVVGELEMSTWFERAVTQLERQHKVSVIGSPGALPARECEALGVARISYGPLTQRVALRALRDLATDLYGGGDIPEDTPQLN